MRSIWSTNAQIESAPYHIRAMDEFPETGPPRKR